LHKWDRHEHLTAFGKRLDDDQTTLVRSDITISDEDKLQFYLEQMYDSNMFDKAEMMEWEQQTINIKTDYVLAKHHFELKVKAHDTYSQNSSGGAAGRNKYESANNMADIGDEIKNYIAKMASASVTNDDVVANMREAEKKKDAEMADIAAQIKQLTASVAKLASRGQQNTENDDPNKSRGRRGGIVEQMTKLRNMGGYCSTHGFHPVGLTHDSATCQFKKKDEHNDAATWNNRLSSNTYWPKAIRVAIEQQNHPMWKGKDKPI
jgi:ribosomal protein L31